MKIDFFPIFGWVGMIFILLAYFLVSFEFFVLNSIVPILLNLFGSCLLALDVLKRRAFAVLTLEIIWAGIALVSLVKVLQ